MAIEVVYAEFGRLVRGHRQHLNLTQVQLAERVGLSRTSITNIERGTQHISLHQLFLLASAVGVAPQELLPDEEVALEELVPARALKGLRADEQDLDFAVRVLRKNPAVTQSAAEASANE